LKYARAREERQSFSWGLCELETGIDVLTGSGSPMDNATRLIRTEINDVHGEAYISGALAYPNAARVCFLLSPAHLDA
jgi:hypothetical protein